MHKFDFSKGSKLRVISVRGLVFNQDLVRFFPKVSLSSCDKTILGRTRELEISAVVCKVLAASLGILSEFFELLGFSLLLFSTK